MSKVKIQRLLTRRLGLDSPRFVLENDGDMVIGSVISPTFEGADDFRRQQLIRQAVRDELGEESAHQVGMIFAFTPDEWDFDAPKRVSNGKPRERARRPARRRTAAR